ncbi:response regulator transcription factor [Streptomyces sp. TG1A-8]|uniref:response regulator transcription factor n=1 Tax=Streptomyces sp. TG1A-8 TaxID=3051385 RepID=UPI00265BF50C|nr:response regulator transcription factor [Streptomyces sp. TG1A-8]MDO0924674.1 response regulator transcription factor [Streptomyces sp. TG1A-8]
MAKTSFPGNAVSLRSVREVTVRPRRSPAPTVLVADSDPLSRHIIGTTLRDSGMVLGVTTVDAGRPLREWRLDGVEVVLWSVGSSGDVSRQVRALTARRIRVLLLSARWTTGEIRSALAAGATGLLTKDARIDRLVVAVNAAAAGYTLVNSELAVFVSPAVHGGHSGADRETPGSGTDDVKPHPAQKLLNLSDREFEVLSHLASGRSTGEVAKLLDIKAATVKSHVSHLLAKLQVRNRVEAVLIYQQVITQHSSVIPMDTQAQAVRQGPGAPQDGPKARFAC